MRPFTAAVAGIVLATLALSVGVVSRLQPDRRWRDSLRSRLLFGVPWGTLIVIAVVLAVYLFVQDGLTDPAEPVTVPYRAWSYFSPVGMLTAPFAHASPSHLISNLAGTAAVAPIAEFAWGHYPSDRARTRQDGTWQSLWRTPWIRAIVWFPLAVIAVGLVTSLFALGPVIGFSGVVFAFMGFAIVQYPIRTLIAAIGFQGVVLTVWRTLQEPIFRYTATPSPPTAPSWAGIAIQGHALGFFIGLVLGMILLARRDTRPDPLHVWVAVLLVAFSKGLWQIYWYGEGNTYFLLRGPGIVIITVLALVITLALTASDRPILPERLDRWLARRRGTQTASRTPHSSSSASDSETDARIERTLELAETGESERVREVTTGRRRRHSQRASALTRRGVAGMIVVLVLAVLAGMAIPVNTSVIATDGDAPGQSGIDIRGYTIEYDENATNELVSGIGIGAMIDDSSLAGSGVIVSSDRYNLWQEVVTKEYLNATGEETITVGGPGWRETAHVERTGWTPVGNESVYQIWLWEDGAETERQLAHESGSSRAEVILAERTVTVTTDGGEFGLRVESIETGATASAEIPAENAITEAGGITFERVGDTVFARVDGTEVAVAAAERYEY
ncbi:rhomboid family intramembrane serine protease [Natrialba asiatica]|uniref:Rhomboid family protein n=1 Tax=Natrialba asiatica (strain ATCC 700177 / DSM 12278 / JCM 9576 / FERM P-10747 / NBRC 102637 / 172P1) TaxID=29540 RepID=M0ASD8_NATA1|nr:rhomboid family intramembrane serine protease [Natrialba asiatica]ELZ01237.1 Rhomboid family protein [Natrialba asiatica DSM 12278]